MCVDVHMHLLIFIPTSCLCSLVGLSIKCDTWVANFLYTLCNLTLLLFIFPVNMFSHFSFASFFCLKAITSCYTFMQIKALFTLIMLPLLLFTKNLSFIRPDAYSVILTFINISVGCSLSFMFMFMYFYFEHIAILKI